jgi:hypothetical protein
MGRMFRSGQGYALITFFYADEQALLVGVRAPANLTADYMLSTTMKKEN